MNYNSIIDDNSQEQNRIKFAKQVELLGLGFNTIPCVPNTKKTIFEWKKYQTEPVPFETLEGWYTFNNDFEWALLTGKHSGVIVVDLDNHDMVEFARNSIPESTMKTITHRGEHWYYKYDEFSGIKNVKPLVLDNVEYNIDIKTDGGYVMTPESVHKTGTIYKQNVQWTKELINSLPPFKLVYDAWKLYNYKRDLVKVEMPSEIIVDPKDYEDNAEQFRDHLKSCGPCKQGKAIAYMFALTMCGYYGFLVEEDDLIDILYDFGQSALNADGLPYDWSLNEITGYVRGASKKDYTKGIPGHRLTKKLDYDLLDSIIKEVPDNLNELFPEKEELKKNRPLLCSIDELFSMTETEFEYIIPDLLPKGKFHIIVGPPKDGKTTFAQQLAFEMIPRLNIPVLYFDYENDTSYFKKFILEPYFSQHPDKIEPIKKNFFISNRQVDHPKLKLPHYLTVDALDKILQETGECWILADSMRRMFSKDPRNLADWENKQSEIDRHLGPFVDYCHVNNLNMSIIQHTNKVGKPAGSGDITAIADLTWFFNRERINDVRTNIAEMSMEGRGVDEKTRFFKFENGRYEPVGDKTDRKLAVDNELAILFGTDKDNAPTAEEVWNKYPSVKTKWNLKYWKDSIVPYLKLKKVEGTGKSHLVSRFYLVSSSSPSKE